MRKGQFNGLFTRFGARTLAELLGVHPQTVRRWQRDSVPKTQEQALQSLLTIHTHQGLEEKSLVEMMGLAEGQGKLPKVKRYNRQRNGKHTLGREVSLPFTSELEPASFLQLRGKLENESVARQFPNWIASITVSARVGEVEKAGSGDVRLQVDHSDTNQFVVESIISSGLTGSRAEALSELTRLVKEKMQDTESVYFMHGAYLSSYRYKTEEEKTDTETEKRRRRKRKEGKRK